MVCFLAHNESFLFSKKKPFVFRVSLSLLCVSLCLFSLFFLSCNQQSESASFIGTLDTIDAHIKNGRVTEAFELLNKTTKKSSSVQQWLALYKRYSVLGEYEFAEALLKKAYKKHPESMDVAAVYSWFLLNQNRLDDADKVVRRLKGTKYGSLFTELQIKRFKNKNDWISPDFVQYCLDAEKTVRDGTFLQNAAVILASLGDMSQAMSLHPEYLGFNDNPLFWATIAYDAGRYAQSYYDLNQAAPSATNLLMRADAAVQLGELDSAFMLWKKCIEFDPNFSPVPYFNIARLAAAENNLTEQYQYIENLIKRFPDYMPGLVAYGDFVLYLNAPEDQDELGKAVRSSGLKTLKMQLFDSRPKIPISDALYRMEQAFEKNADPQLFVEMTRLQWRLKTKTAQEKAVDLWLMLEKQPNNPYLIQYMVWFFMSQKKYQDAFDVFNAYLEQKYHSTDYNALAENFLTWETEYAAWLSGIFDKDFKAPDYALSLKLYTKVLQSPRKSVSALMNYAVLKGGTVYGPAALELYAQASALVQDTLLKAEIQYRLGKIYLSMNDKKNALVSLTYCLNLNPDHNKARLLLKQNS